MTVPTWLIIPLALIGALLIDIAWDWLSRSHGQ